MVALAERIKTGRYNILYKNADVLKKGVIVKTYEPRLRQVNVIEVNDDHLMVDDLTVDSQENRVRRFNFTGILDFNEVE